MTHHITTATLDDFAAIYRTFMGILEEGETYSYRPEDFTVDAALKYWMGANTHCYAAKQDDDGAVAGAVALRPNREGRGSHIANASFMVAEQYRGQGIARSLGEHLIDQAKTLRFKGIQFNFVVSSNEIAVTLWQKLGFRIIGTTPKGFQHQTRGLVDVHIMYMEL